MAEDRDRQSQGRSRSLVPLGGYSMTWPQGNGAGWFGPLAPMNPVAPPSVKGRLLDYPSGYNLAIRPKAYEPISFEQLRNFADAFDVLRLVIETRKDQMANLQWNLGVRKQFADTVTIEDPAIAAKAKAIREFFIRPDGENFWPDWLRLLLEDLFVLDAPALYRQRTLGGELISLDPLDGATIKRVIDDNARTPPPPTPAYQQILKGMPAVDYTTQDLIYRPRNKRTHKIYGFSPVEQIVMTINIALRRQVWQLQSFTEGNIPEALIGVPSGWTPDQIEQFQNWFDQMLEGNTAQRRKAKFVPGDIAKSFFATKPDKLFDAETEEWIARVVCFAFSVSPQPFVKMMNRATAATAQEVAVEEGLIPIMSWTKGVMDTIILEDFGCPQLELIWEEEDELDPNIKSQIIDREQAAGRLTMNEARKEQGLDPIAEPDADRPMFKTVTGWVPIYLTAEEQATKDAAAAAIAGGGAPGAGPDDGSGAPPNSAEEGSDADLSADEELSDTQGAAGKSDAPFSESASGAGLFKAKPRKTYVDPERRAAVRQKNKAKAKLISALSALGVDVARQIRAKMAGLGKAHDNPVDIEEILAGLHIEFDDDLEMELSQAMADVYGSAGRLALGQLGSRLTSELVDQVNDRSLSWARENAAELVSGLEEATRDMLRATIASGIENNLSAEALGDSLEQSYGFSEDRADLIATTEIAGANSMGALDGYKDAAGLGITVRKSWLILDDACDDCQANEADGAIELDAAFSSGDDAPPAHPNCRCVLVPEVEDDDGNVEELDEVDDE